MARESTEVQCYPSDSKIRETIARYESFGWELLGNQRFQEFTGQTSDSYTITNHYSTYNKLSFTRETSAPWYKKVTELEKQHDELIDKKEMYERWRPSPPSITKGLVLLFLVLFLASVVPVVFLSETLKGASCLFLALSPILMIVTAIVRNVKYNHAYSDWHTSYYSKIGDLEKEAKAIREKSHAIVLNG